MVYEDGCVGWIAESGTSGLREEGWWDPEGGLLYIYHPGRGRRETQKGCRLQIARARVSSVRGASSASIPSLTLSRYGKKCRRVGTLESTFRQPRGMTRKYSRQRYRPGPVSGAPWLTRPIIRIRSAEDTRSIIARVGYSLRRFLAAPLCFSFTPLAAYYVGSEAHNTMHDVIT